MSVVVLANTTLAQAAQPITLLPTSMSRTPRGTRRAPLLAVGRRWRQRGFAGMGHSFVGNSTGRPGIGHALDPDILDDATGCVDVDHCNAAARSGYGETATSYGAVLTVTISRGEAGLAGYPIERFRPSITSREALASRFRNRPCGRRRH